jgi:diguanylate cyclase (GGDEF)-like protein/PAS domain S-box-containing protein
MTVPNQAKIQAILDSTEAGTWELNLDSGELRVNERWAQMLGFELSELKPISFGTWEQLSHPLDLEKAKSRISDAVDHKVKVYECVVRMRHKDGTWHFIHTRGKLFDDDEGHWIVGVHLDITEKKQSQYQLAQLAESLPGIIYSFVMKPDGTYHFPYMSRKTQDFYGFPPELAMSNPEYIFDVIHPDDLENVRKTIAESYESLSEWTCEYRVQIKGKSLWMRGVSLPEKESDGSVTWHGMVINIDTQKRLEAELERLAITDDLTGAFNRRHMLGQLETYLAEYTRYAQPFSLVSIDIDHFKTVNDNYGHLVGDDVLKTFSKIIFDRVRKTDTFARAGGEEFLILMPHTLLSDAANLVESIRETFENYRFKAPGDRTFQVTISAGVVGFSNQPIAAMAELLSLCDQALYSAKNGGRNRLVLKAM